MFRVTLGAFIISFAAVFVRAAGLAPDTATFYRMAFGGAAMLALLAREGRLRSVLPLLVPSIPAAMLFTGDFFCWHRSIFAVGPGLATMLGNLSAVFIALFSVLFLAERAGLRFFTALAMALAGVFLTVGPVWNSAGEDFHTGVLFGLTTALFYASYILSLKKMVGKTGDVLATATAVTLTTATLCGLLVLFSGGSFVLPDAKAWSSMLALGVLCQCVGWLCITTGLGETRASLASLLLLLQPVLSFVWDILFFDKPIRVVEISGVALALAGIYLGSLRRGNKVKSSKQPEPQIPNAGK